MIDHFNLPVRDVRQSTASHLPVLVVVVLLGAFPVVAGEGDGPAGTPALSLFAGGSSVAVDDDTAVRLGGAVTDFFESCRRYADVVLGEQPSPEKRARMWEEGRRGSHLLLRTIGASGSRHVALRGKRFTLLLGLEPGRGPRPVLTRDAEGDVTTYAKCDGLTGLLLSCDLDDVIPGRKPSADCHRWRELHSDFDDPVR